MARRPLSRRKARVQCRHGPSPRPRPPAFDGLRVAFVADIRPGSFVSRARVRATVDRVNALHPDLIVLGGDYIYRRESAAGIRELYDGGVWLRRDGARLRLSGLSGLTEDRQTASEALDGATADDFVLLANHSPDIADALAGAPVDLLLAGHTHGGQVTVFGLWAPFVPSRYGQEHRAGIVPDAPVPTFVTTGVGTILVPLRFFARPEIVLLTLRRD